jgi:HNH endonuclease
MQSNPIAFLSCLHCQSPFPIYDRRQANHDNLKRRTLYCESCRCKTWRYFDSARREADAAKDNDCRLWPFSTTNGYGVMRVPESRRIIPVTHYLYHYVHRYCYEIYAGAIPADMEVCHTCDVPSCFRWRHLFLGTPKTIPPTRFRKGGSAQFLN